MTAMLSRVQRTHLRELRDLAVWRLREVQKIEDRIARLIDIPRGVGEQEYFDHITDFASGLTTINEFVVSIRTLDARRASEGGGI